jgi:hypothetical protein
VNSPPPKPEVILTNFFAEPIVLLVPITSRVKIIHVFDVHAFVRIPFFLFAKYKYNIRILLVFSLKYACDFNLQNTNTKFAYYWYLT